MSRVKWSPLALASVGLALSLAACRPENNLDTGVTETEVPPAPDLPILLVEEPARGVFLNEPVAVRGRAQAGTGALSELAVHELDTTIAGDGGFEQIIEPPPGLFLIGSRLKDDNGQRAVDARAVHVGPVNPPGTLVTDAVVIEFGRAFLDDDDPEPDDVAAVVERILVDPEFTGALTGQTFGESVPVTLTSMSTSAARVDIDPQAGIVYFDMRLSDLQMGFTASPVGVDIVGSTTSDEARIYIDLVVEPGADGIIAQAALVEVDLRGFTFETDALPASVASSFAATIRNVQEESLAEVVQEMVPTLFATLLESFTFELPIGGGTVDIDLSVADIESHWEGLVLSLDASVDASTGISLPSGAGSLHTEGDAPTFPTNNGDPLTIAIDDDFVNQLLFAAWQVGVMSDVQLTGTELILLSGEDLPPPLGPVENVTVDLGLPPVLSPTQDLGNDGLFSADLSIGELVLDIERDDGERVRTSIGVSAGVDLGVVGSGITLGLDNRPTAMIVQSGMLNWPDALDPGDLSSLFRLSAPGLVGGALDFLPALPTPEIDLGALSEAQSLQGVTWTITEANVEMQETGWLVIAGRME